MNKEKILQTVLQNEKLKEAYWPNEELSILNTRTLIKSENKYIKSLNYVFDQLPKKTKAESLLKMFKL